MFKKPVLAAAAILVTVSLAGCGSGTTPNAASTTTTTQTQQANGQTNNGIVLPSDKAAYIGKVVDIANNQVTINKAAELPAQPQGAPPGANQEAQQGAAPQPGTQDTTQGANEKSPGPGGQMKFSDQAETITIPEAAQVVTGSPRDGNISTIKVSDIKKDQIIQVWEKDGAITFVQVMDSNRNAPNGSAQQQQAKQ